MREISGKPGNTLYRLRKRLSFLAREMRRYSLYLRAFTVSY